MRTILLLCILLAGCSGKSEKQNDGPPPQSQEVAPLKPPAKVEAALWAKVNGSFYTPLSIRRQAASLPDTFENVRSAGC